MSTMRPEVVFAIRDARGFDANEKTILFVVESRGTAYGTAETIAADCGMGDNRFYKWRRRLIDLGVLEATERHGSTTEYRVNADALRTFGSSQIGGLPETGSPQIGEGGRPEIGRGVSPNRGAKVEPLSTTPQVEPDLVGPATENDRPDVWAIARAQREVDLRFLEDQTAT